MKHISVGWRMPCTELIVYLGIEYGFVHCILESRSSYVINTLTIYKFSNKSSMNNEEDLSFPLLFCGLLQMRGFCTSHHCGCRPISFGEFTCPMQSYFAFMFFEGFRSLATTFPLVQEVTIVCETFR